MQRTITVGSDKIKIKVSPSTYMGNPNGFIVRVNDKKYKFLTLTAQEAMDKGFAKYIKENR